MGKVLADARSEIGSALESKLTPEQIKILLDEILAITKSARGWCPNCKKQVRVEIPDAKSVTGALIDLANQAWGRPDVAAISDDEKIVFERVVYMGAEE